MRSDPPPNQAVDFPLLEEDFTRNIRTSDRNVCVLLYDSMRSIFVIACEVRVVESIYDYVDVIAMI